MKNKAETQETADELPNFLNELDDTGTHDQGEQDATEPVDDAQDYEQEGEFEDEGEGYDEGYEEAEEEPVQASSRGTRENSAPVAPAGGVGMGAGMVAGVASIVTGVGLGLCNTVPAVSALAPYGLQPATMLVLGALLIAAASVRRNVLLLERRLGAGSSEDTAALRADVQSLVESQRAHEARAPAAGEELQHVLLLLQRQDEKVNNLTKAIKMYGKPLMEIAGQTTELAGALNQLRTSIDVSSGETREAIARIEATTQASAGLGDGIERVLTAVEQVGAATVQLGKSRGKDLSIEPLQQQTGRIEVAVQALAQRLEDTEVRRSLVRLEDAAKKAQEEMQLLLRGEKVSAVATQLQKALDTAASRLLEGIGQLREGNLGGLESSVKEIHREVAGVATIVNQIQTAVRTGARQAQSAAPATSNQAPAAAPAPVAAAASSSGTPAAAGAGGAAAAGGYQTGARSTSGKNVLGAIAKLKQMKS